VRRLDVARDDRRDRRGDNHALDIRVVLLDGLENTKRTVHGGHKELLRVVGLKVEGRGHVKDGVDVLDGLVESVVLSDVLDDDIAKVTLALEKVLQVVALRSAADGTDSLVAVLQERLDGMG